jgi:hypothetical protein
MNIIQIGCHMGDDHVLIKFKNNTRVSIIKEFLDYPNCGSVELMNLNFAPFCIDEE